MAQRNGGTPSYSVTSAGVNPVEDRAHRMRMYFTAMTLRVVCVGSLFWVRGWWVLIPLAGAVILPWFAVMVGNAVAHGGEQRVDVLDPLEITTADQAPAPAAQEVLIIDVEPVRRAESPAATHPSAPHAAAPHADPPAAADDAAAITDADAEAAANESERPE